MEKKFTGLLAALMIIWGCATKPTDNPGSKNGNLEPCPESPNCVSTLSHDSRHAMPPLPYVGEKDHGKQRLIEIIKSMERSKIISMSDSYIHAEFRTRLFGFVDEVEFDDSSQSYLVQVSVPVKDGGKAIGAITFGIDVDKID